MVPVGSTLWVHNAYPQEPATSPTPAGSISGLVVSMRPSGQGTGAMGRKE